VSPTQIASLRRHGVCPGEPRAEAEGAQVTADDQRLDYERLAVPLEISDASEEGR
jgi:hypothetical protein